MLLKKENYVPYKLDNERLIDWVVKSVDEHYFSKMESKNFGCDCSKRNEFSKLGFALIEQSDFEWEPWMSDMDERGFHLYFCFHCKQWSIDAY